jgi:hypothetical protein
MALVKTTLAHVLAIAFIALFGLIGVSKAADIFQTDDFSGKITFTSPMVMPSGQKMLTLNYTGVTTFDETKVAALSPALQVYSSFIPDGGSVSVTLDFPFGNLTLTPSGGSQPTLVVQNNKAVGFDFDMTRGGTVPAELKLNAPIPNSVTPGSGTTTYTGVLDNVTLTVTFPSPLGKEIVAGSTVATFTVVPELGTLTLVCVGAALFGLISWRSRSRMLIPLC